MDPLLTRRRLIFAAAALPLAALPACTTLGDLQGFGFENALRRLLTVSSQRAFANLLTDNGFFSDELARVPLPPQLAGAGGIASALLRTPAVQNQLLGVMNRAASEAAEAAAPIVYDSIRNMTISDAMALVRGGPTAATDFLQRAMGTAIVDAMVPGVGNALRLFDSGIVNQVVQAATGISFAGLQRHVSETAANGIYRAIGREEAAIRANPSSANDPTIASVFGLLR
ncbi:MAG TPA: DUF4197 domain-containing protein [Allosphingosinicella sp.]